MLRAWVLLGFENLFRTDYVDDTTVIPSAATRILVNVKLPRALKPFSSPAYRVLVFAMCMSVFGSGLWAVAMVARVMALGGSSVDLSLVAASGGLGAVVFVLVGGVTADRVPLNFVLRGVEMANLATALTLAVLTWSGHLALWHLAVGAFVFAGAVGFFYPAYSAALPRILPPTQLLAANGVEGTARPLLQISAGPAVGGALTAVAFPGAGVVAIAMCHLLALLMMLRLRIPEEIPPDDAQPSPSVTVEPHEIRGAIEQPDEKASVFTDLVEGFRYTVRTPWLKWTLLWAMCSVFLFMGPLEVLVPFLVVERLGGSVASFGAMLGIYGAATAAGSMITASLPMPKKYLTTMIWLWGFGALPFGLVGMTDSWWVMVLALCVFGATGGAGMVIWGTLLQRRVPIHMLGRVSSLDFFVSLSLMPISMAVAGPVSQVLAPEIIFWGVAILTPVLGILAVWAGRMYQDQAAHPLS